MKNKAKVVFVVVTTTEEKVIFVETEVIEYRELKEIGNRVVALMNKYPNTNVSFKVYG